MKIDRLISMIMVLLNCEKISATKLAHMFEVTPRTIYRDIDVIEKAGIPIFTTTGSKGGIGILPAYKIDKNLFTSSDIQTILMGLSSVSTTLSSKDIIGTLEKVKNLLPEKHTIKAPQITVDLTTWMGNKNILLIIEQIKHALNKNLLIMFSYCNNNGIISTRHVEPYQLVLKDTHWYLHAYCLNKQDFRVFKLSRISNFVVDKTSFIPRNFSPKPLDGKDWISHALIPIQLLVDASLYEKMMELCGEEHIKPHTENTFLVEFMFVPDDYGYNILLGFGPNCECIAPIEVRTELINRIEKLVSIYKR
ncbi:MAG: YafY family transcriptional regulator [Firmicutes bacterium HGW-Firmicutes-3]|nr:MAG: YafY family transcriptional regulator [Firmicutes bacterium HGW-Firmicutes-3]